MDRDAPLQILRIPPWLCAALLAVSPTPGLAEDDLRGDGKLLMTNGATGLEGGAGGGLATWAVIAGNATENGIGGSVHATIVELPDYGLQSHGASVGLFNRIELSYARQNFDTRAAGAALGLGRNFRFNQDMFGAKIRLLGDVVYGAAALPQISIGVQHKVNRDGDVVRAIGAAHDQSTDVYVSATKLFLAHSILANATLRLTEANQFGLLGFGAAGGRGHQLQFEGSLAYQVSRRLVIGGEYRTRPDNLGFAEEGDAYDIFAAWAVTRHLTLTGAYVDAGPIATLPRQRGGYVSLQVAF